MLGQTKLLAITDVAKSEISSAATGTGAYIQKNWWKWVVVFILLVLAAFFVLFVLVQLRKRKIRRLQMEKRRRTLERRRRSYEDDGYRYHDDDFDA